MSDFELSKLEKILIVATLGANKVLKKASQALARLESATIYKKE